MIVTRLRVEHLKGIASRELAFEPGLNIIGGPNESGKSTLREALTAALFYPYNASRKEIRELSPWNGAGLPRVELELKLAEQHFKIEKTFGKRKDGASLLRDGRLIAQDARVQETLEAAFREAGELDWLGLLWGVQGSVGVDLKAPRSLQDRLQAAAGSAISPQLEKLWEKIEEEHARSFTPKTGRPRKALQDAREEQLAAEAELAAAEESLAEADERAAEVASLQERVSARAIEGRERMTGLEHARAALGAWSQFRTAREALERERLRLVALERRRDLELQLEELTPLAEVDRRRQKELQLRLVAPPSREAIERLAHERRFLELLSQQAVESELASLRAPEALELQRLRSEQRRLEKLEAALAVEAKLTARVALSPALTVDGEARPLTPLAQGEQHVFSATGPFVLDLPGVATLSVESANRGSVEERRQVERSLRDALRGSTLEELEERFARAASLRGRLPSGKVDVEAELARLRGKLAPASLELLDADQRAEQLAGVPRRLEELETAWKTAQQGFQNDQAELARLLKENRVGRLDALLERLRDHPSDETPLEELRERLARLEGELKRPEGDEVTAEGLASLERSLEAWRSEGDELRARLERDIGALEGQSELYVRKRQASERLARVSERLAEADGEAFAIHFLRETLAGLRAELERTYQSPLQARVGERLATLTEGKYRGVALDRGWGITGVLPSATEGDAPVGALSFGTQEQLAFLCRLCLAELLAETQGQRHLVIFDDNLVHTDEARMAIACRWLKETAERAQVLVLTCHPERYKI